MSWSTSTSGGGGVHQAPEFVKISPFWQVPVLDDSGTTLFDSNAILVYLATKYDACRRWLPLDPKEQADVQAWLSMAPAKSRLALQLHA